MDHSTVNLEAYFFYLKRRAAAEPSNRVSAQKFKPIQLCFCYVNSGYYGNKRSHVFLWCIFHYAKQRKPACNSKEDKLKDLSSEAYASTHITVKTKGDNTKFITTNISRTAKGDN